MASRDRVSARTGARPRRTPHSGIVLTLAAIGCFFLMYSHLRAQSTTSTGSARTTVVPLRPLAALSTVPNPDVPELKDYVVNATALVQLGKALFWDMQTGSDGVQACASCHFNAGADSRGVNSVSPGLAGNDTTFQLGVPKLTGGLGPNYQLHAGTADDGSFGGYHNGDFPLHKQGDVNSRNNPQGDVNDVVGSQGVFASNLDHIVLGSGVDATFITSDTVFSFPDPADATKVINTRRVTGRNTPSNINAVFNYRNFWDGRARNICNGANPFGERDTNSHFYYAGSRAKQLAATLVRLHNSSLCSQALGPALSPVEMSADNRSFKELGKKLLSVNPLQNTANTTPLGKQLVDPTDSVLGPLSKGAKKYGLKTTYTAMIQNAFNKKWWDSQWHICMAADNSETLIDPTAGQVCPTGSSDYSLMAYNFSLFWGIAIQAYESTLRADQTPLDQYLAQQQGYTLTGDNVTNAFNIALPAGIVPYTLSLYAENPTLDASDQEVFAFDDGNGHVAGVGVTSGTINYATGAVTLFFDLPPTKAFPVQIKYSVGTSTPLTKAQLHGLQVFQTKGRCIACHGGPELTNASVANVTAQPLERMLMGDLKTIRVYDNGFYNIGVRPAVEDNGQAGVDGAAGRPLSEAADEQLQVCADPSLTIMVPSRPGEFIAPGPLTCYEPIARVGNLKTPGLRNIALTAPYFHNGGQLTLEQVVEFYNRGGDFPDGFDQIPLMDPNITTLLLTTQEKTDLVDFLRTGLTDSRTVSQQAPFDHPQLFLPNGHPWDSSGYPVVNDLNHPGQATDQPYPMMMVPAVGSAGGAPLPTFLQNLAKP